MQDQPRRGVRPDGVIHANVNPIRRLVELAPQVRRGLQTHHPLGAKDRGPDQGQPRRRCPANQEHALEQQSQLTRLPDFCAPDSC
jgi:hypothetical protein